MLMYVLFIYNIYLYSCIFYAMRKMPRNNSKGTHKIHLQGKLYIFWCQ